MNPTRRNLLASSGVLVSVAALGGASPALAEQVTAPPTRKNAGGSKTDTTRDPFAQLAYQRAEQYPSTDYIDIREYGTVTDGGDITAAMQATINAFSTHNCSRIRIPRLGTAGFTWSPGTTAFGGSQSWILEIDAPVLELKTQFNIRTGMRVLGRTSSFSASFLSEPAPRPFIRAHSSVSLDPVVQIGGVTGSGGQCWLEGVAIVGDAGVALKVDQTNLFTIKHCAFSTDADAPALLINQSFWGNIEHIFCQPRAAGDNYCMELTNSIDHGPGGGTDCGILRFKDFRCGRAGILISAEFGPTGTNNIVFEDTISENFIDGNNLFNFHTIGDSAVTQIVIRRAEIADALGTCYIMKNTNGTNKTTGVVYEGRNEAALIDPTSDPIKSLIINNQEKSPLSNNYDDLIPVYAGTTYWDDWVRVYPTAIDTHLLTAPVVGANWNYGTPLAVVQNPASWTALGGATITPGLLGPDGSTNAGSVSGGSGAQFYTGSHTLAVGDWIIAGGWMHATGAGTHLNSGFKISLTNADYNASTSEPFFGANRQDFGMAGTGWQWTYFAAKITSVTSSPNTVSITTNGFNRRYFAPCAILIPVSDAIEDDWALRIARSMRGSWSSTSVAGDVSVLDHQSLQAGVFKAVPKTFATLPSSPVAGMIGYITNCNTTTWGATAAGGGANPVLVWYNGTNWTVMGK
jgi:hypothetical protein